MALLTNLQTNSGATSTYQRIVGVRYDKHQDEINWYITIECYVDAEKRAEGLKPLQTTTVQIPDYAVAPRLLKVFYSLVGEVINSEGDEEFTNLLWYKLPDHDPCPPGAEV